jgi:hypothetical protein
MSDPQERRRARRVEASGHVVLTGEAGTLTGQLRDLSVDAALLEAPESWPLGSTVELDLTLPGDPDHLHLQGEVIRHAVLENGGRGMAILFADMPPNAATRIDLFLARQERP